MNKINNQVEDTYESEVCKVSKRKIIRLPFRIACFFIGAFMLYGTINIILNHEKHEAIGIFLFVPLGIVMSAFTIWLALVKDENIKF